MDATALALIAALGVLVLVHLLAERAASRWQFLTKGAASACFVALGVIAHAAPPMLVALALAFVGDLLLVPKDHRVFRAGIVVFLLAHVALGVAFAMRGLSTERALIVVPALAVTGWTVGRALLPRVPPALRAAVLAYMVVISAMVALASGASYWLLVPALAFYANDLLVARDRFAEKKFWHRAVGLPLYYGAMAIFALS